VSVDQGFSEDIMLLLILPTGIENKLRSYSWICKPVWS